MADISKRKMLWSDYLFVSKELAKFAEIQDSGMVEDLLEQRERIQEMIDQAPEDGFIATEEGRRLIAVIGGLNQQIMICLRGNQQRLQTQHAVFKAYDAMSMYQG